MKQFISYLMISAYCLFNLFGHAGLHALLGDSCADHLCVHPHREHVLIVGSRQAEVKKPQSKCNTHCCHKHASHNGRVETVGTSVHTDHNSDIPQHNDEHQGDDEHECQLGLYFAQAYMDIILPTLIEQTYELESKVLATSQRLGLLICFSYDVRGPPAVCFL